MRVTPLSSQLTTVIFSSSVALLTDSTLAQLDPGAPNRGLSFGGFFSHNKKRRAEPPVSPCRNLVLCQVLGPNLSLLAIVCVEPLVEFVVELLYFFCIDQPALERFQDNARALVDDFNA